MPKIKSLVLEGYKSYKDKAVIEFDDLNSIVGGNDSGKSNIYKALDMVLNHKPFPESALYTDPNTGKSAKKALVRVTLDDDSYIERVRNGKSQSIKLVDSEGEEVESTKVADCAELVEKFGFNQVTLTDSLKGNLQFVPLEEGSVPFLIAGNSTSSVLKLINAFSKGVEIEKAKVRLSKDARRLKSEISLRTQDLEKAEREFDRLDSPKWQTLLGLRDSIEELLDDHSELGHAIDEYKRVQDVMREIGKVKQTTKKLQKIYDDNIDKYNALRQNLDETDEKIKECNKFGRLLANKERVENKIAMLQKELKDKQAEERKVCPTCGRPL